MRAGIQGKSLCVRSVTNPLVRYCGVHRHWWISESSLGDVDGQKETGPTSEPRFGVPPNGGGGGVGGNEKRPDA